MTQPDIKISTVVGLPEGTIIIHSLTEPYPGESSDKYIKRMAEEHKIVLLKLGSVEV